VSAQLLSVVLALIAAFLFACGSAAQQNEAATVSADESLIFELIRRPRWWLGIAGDFGGYIFQAAALAIGSVLVVQPLVVTAVLFALPVSAMLGAGRFGRTTWIWAAVLALALAAFLLLGNPTAGNDDAPGRAWWPSLAVTTVVAVVLVLAGSVPRLGGGTRAMLLGAATGVSFGVCTVLTKPVLTSFSDTSWWSNTVRLTTDWRLYVLVGSGLLAMYLQQRAFQPAPISASLPAITVVEPLVAALLGAVVLGERVELGGWHGPAVLGAAAITVVAAMRLAGRTDNAEPTTPRAYAAGSPPVDH
jgi:drug/metabolite transporter (DMT)-like permease